MHLEYIFMYGMSLPLQAEMGCGAVFLFLVPLLFIVFNHLAHSKDKSAKQFR